MYDGIELNNGMLRACWPWESLDSVEKDYRGSLQLVLKSDIEAQDRQREIDKCLSCKKMKCTNCLDKKKSGYVKKKLVVRQCENQMVMEM